MKRASRAFAQIFISHEQQLSNVYLSINLPTHEKFPIKRHIFFVKFC